jgi:hypothetical protein
VGLQSGNDTIIHASSYWGHVVEKPKFWPGCGYVGAVVWR